MKSNKQFRLFTNHHRVACPPDVAVPMSLLHASRLDNGIGLLIKITKAGDFSQMDHRIITDLAKICTSYLQVEWWNSQFLLHNFVIHIFGNKWCRFF